MTSTDKMQLDAAEEPFPAFVVVLMVLAPLAMAAFGVWWLLN
jgi:hypothetical protein